ncbi:chloride channel protein [Agrobacterium tumefaciens]|uniref:Chloride channel protein n=1 Tax=Agrobacterium tumefaciens TaxID=358 RepID=A0AA44F0S4_AGRTU|nr:chloride channel protein [Agrobacterium tumefaciens]NSL22433.1 chloride channel protein [Agrobacterium tumefaciens]NTB84534.1 chloride channel protein [Agrobacterium tumefaciens]NTC20412.1 chloride channel protein [Agrobacterium tumefaciens]NTC26974.1 chloride channel protein [Agrobacterium tumefaciens]NTC57180.1 chloride channel protein [Agrobacterium tumefaciens]
MPVDYKKLKMLRRSRVVWGSWRVWKPRAVFWIGALAVGIISVGFAWAADSAQHLFFSATSSGEWAFLLPLVVTPLGFTLCAWLALTVFPNAGGSGIPQAIAARHLRDDADRSRLLSLKLAFGKVALTVVGLLSGASIGREGPTVQVGASIMLQAARWGGMAQAKGLILAGSAAGIAAAFNTPLAGIVFAIEEMSKTYESRANGLVLTAVILSGLASLALVGSYTYFGTSSVMAKTMMDWLLVLVCGIGGGAFGALFSAGALRLSARIRRFAQAMPSKRMLAVAAACGLASAVIGIATDGATFGTGYEQARAAIEGQAAPAFFFIEKLAATFLAMMSGIPGGIFAPSLSVGAGFGSTMATLLGTSIGLGAIVGMAGYFAGVVQAPMTAFVIILEMTGNHDGVIPIMVASMLGYLTSRLFSREPLYHGLSRVFIAQSIRAKRAAHAAET